MDEALHRGDVVEVRSAAEILATLDNSGMLDGLPFMPEMLHYCGRRFRVTARADKICATMYAGSQELPSAVFLDDVRCDGSGHDGCQAGCRIFWKEAWLRRVDPGKPSCTYSETEADAALEARVRATSKEPARDGTCRYVCQATESHRASHPFRTVDVGPYVQQVRSGNVGWWRFARVMLRALTQEVLLRLGLRDMRPMHGSGAEPVDVPRLDLQPGDVVRVKSREEIACTLSPDGSDHGVAFDDENVPYCGGTFRVHRRVNHLIDEFTGCMMDLDRDWYMLDNVVCSGEHSLGRWFCPRAFHVQWTDAWLEPLRAGASGEQRSRPSEVQAHR